MQPELAPCHLIVLIKGQFIKTSLAISEVQAPAMGSNRNVQFDLLRILFAASVLLAHAPELVDGNQSREILHRFAHQFTMGGVGVDGFFLLSGFLIVQSWERKPQLARFASHRLRRIVPGYVVACVLSIAVLGLLAPSGPGFFAGLNFKTFASIVLLSLPSTPDVFPGAHFHLVNGAVWTIAYEFRCYLLVALLGLAGMWRHRWMCAALTAASALAWAPVHGRHVVQWKSNYLLLGEPGATFRLLTVFLVGTCFYVFRDRIPYKPALALVAGAGLLVGIRAMHTEIALILFGGYLMFYFARTPFLVLQRLPRFPDISYGMYLYGWPVEATWAWYGHSSPWTLFAGSLVICFGLGWLSWVLVERPLMAGRRSHPTSKPKVDESVHLHPAA